MQTATHASLVLARFAEMRAAGPVVSHEAEEALFLDAGADYRAAGTDIKSQTAFKFAVFGLHESAESARKAVRDRLKITPWFADASEVWCAVLAPFRHFGEANFLDADHPGPLFGQVQPEPPDGTPIVVITSVGWIPESFSDMDRIRDFGAGVAAVRISMTGVPGLHSQQTFSFPGGLVTDGITVTIWRDFASMRDFAYGPGLHRMQVKRQRAEVFGDRTSFTRYFALQSGGTWHGSDPLA